jgi:hypothetical protein
MEVQDSSDFVYEVKEEHVTSIMKTLCPFSLRPVPIFASQGLRFGSPFPPPLADLEYILIFACNATWWFIEVAPL